MSPLSLLVAVALASVVAVVVRADNCNSTVHPICGAGGSTKELVLNSLQSFCLFLPPTQNVTVNDSEGCCESTWCPRNATGCVPVPTDAVSFCTTAGLTPGARVFPENLFASAHLVTSTDGLRIQITGKLNPVWVSPNDLGGQYDSFGTNQYEVNSPPGGKMNGFAEYVSLVGNGVFCIQACQGSYACNSDNDYSGCTVAIPGDYGDGFTAGTALLVRQNSPNGTNPTGLPYPLIGPPTYVTGPSTVAPPPGSTGPIDGVVTTVVATAVPVSSVAAVVSSVVATTATAAVTVASSPKSAAVSGTSVEFISLTFFLAAAVCVFGVL